MKSRPPVELCSDLISLLKASEVVGKTGKKFTNLSSMSTVNNLFMLQAMMEEFKPTATLEIGFCHGASGLMFTASHRKLGRSPLRQHCAIDPFQASGYDNSGLLNIEQAGLDEFLDFQNAFSSEVLPRYVSEGRRFGLIYVDGSHLFENVFVDFYYSARLLDEGGVIAFDDSAYPHVQKVVAFIRSNLAGQFEELDTNSFKPVPMNGAKYWLARRLGRVQLTAFRKIGPAAREWDAAFHAF